MFDTTHMNLDTIKNNIFGIVGTNDKNKKEDDSNNKNSDIVTQSPSKNNFDFDSDEYSFPLLYQEADAMNQVSLLIYTITDLRSLAKKNKDKLKNPERILNLPLKLKTCLEMLEENIDLIKEEFGSDHEMTLNALQSIQKRYESNTNNQSLSSGTVHHWLNPFVSIKNDIGASGSVELQQHFPSPTLTAYGDDKPDKDLVYAVGIDPNHKRVTVAFRGSVTTADFLTDAMITINKQPNPVLAIDDTQSDTIGIHHGFFEYLLKPRKDSGENKYTEILRHVTKLFEDPEIRRSYKLYVTGHSLGGALATLFSLHVAASAASSIQQQQEQNQVIIPTPVTCISIASPRVGEATFQYAFQHLERCGLLRHLRIANDRDPVTMMPKQSGKLYWSMMSPISYAAFKVMDGKFEENETFRHTGIKLKLCGKTEENSSEEDEMPLYEIEYSSAPAATEKEQEEQRSKKRSIGKKDKKLSKSNKSSNRMPDAVYHMCDAYCSNLEAVKNEFMNTGMTLNELYKTKAVENKYVESNA